MPAETVTGGSSGWARHAPRALLVVVALIALYPATNLAFSVDDHYILRNAESSSAAEITGVYSTACPGPDCPFAWYNGLGSFRRHRIAFLPSLLISVEARLLGRNPHALHRVALALHVIDVLLLYQLLLALFGTWRRATVGALFFAVHPAAVEAVVWLPLNHLLLATGFALLAGRALVSIRQRDSSPWTLLAATFAAMTSYEVAVLLPGLLVIADLHLYRATDGARPWRIRWALLSLSPAYALVMIGYGVSDAPRPHVLPIPDWWPVVRTELLGYLQSVVALPGAHRGDSSWALDAFGEGRTVLVVLMALGPLFVWTVRRPLGRVAWLWVFGLLAPPVLIHVVSITNLPSMRQVYLPAAAIAVVLASLVPLSWRSAGLASLVVGGLVLECWDATTAWTQLPRYNGGWSAGVKKLLSSHPPTTPVIWLGAPFSYNVSLDWPGRSELRLIPRSVTGDGATTLCRTNDQTLVAESRAGFSIAGTHRVGEESNDMERMKWVIESPSLVTEGRQRLAGVTVEGTRAGDGLVHQLRFVLDRPLADYVILSTEPQLHLVVPAACTPP